MISHFESVTFHAVRHRQTTTHHSMVSRALVERFFIRDYWFASQKMNRKIFIFFGNIELSPLFGWSVLTDSPSLVQYNASQFVIDDLLSTLRCFSSSNGWSDEVNKCRRRKKKLSTWFSSIYLSIYVYVCFLFTLCHVAIEEYRLM